MTISNRYYSYPAILDNTPPRTTKYIVTFPDFHGVSAQGEGIHDAIVNGTKALEIALIKLNYRPSRSSIKQIEKENPNKLVINITADMKHATEIIKQT